MVSRVLVCLVCVIALLSTTMVPQGTAGGPQYCGPSYYGPTVSQCAPPQCAPPQCAPVSQCAPRTPFPCAGIFSACTNICGACIGLPAACMAAILAPPRRPAPTCQPMYCPPPCAPPMCGPPPCGPPPCAPAPITKCKPAAYCPPQPGVCSGCPRCQGRPMAPGPQGYPYHYSSATSMSPGFEGLGQQLFEFPLNLVSGMVSGAGNYW